jgi:aspartyl-tRNA(Asn)/glutamyl-tRNA(Gln) amidotransferase subunit A
VSSRADSVAGHAFDAAERALHDLPLDDVRLQPPLRLVLRGAPQLGAHRIEARSAAQQVVRPTPTLKGPTLAEALGDLIAGRTTSRELLETAIEVADATSALGAVVALDRDAARRTADQLDAERAAGRVRGALHGVPLTVKDVIDVGGMPTRGGSLAYEDLDPADAPAVGRLRNAGALVFAKVATHEFALGVTTPQCRNPHDPTRLAGGSSGGSAIAVATGLGVGSLGTDTRASLRVPAALCGVVGFKASFTRVPNTGIIPLSWTIDHVGPIARTVEDAALLIDALADTPFLTIDSDRPPGTVGVVEEVLADADPGVVAACESALSALDRSGWTIVEIDAPSVSDLELANALGLLISRSEAAAFHRGRATDLDRCIPEVRDQLLAGLTVSAADYLDAQRQRDVLGARVLEAFSRCDVIAAPTSPVVAPAHDDYERYLLRLSRNTLVWSMTGAPAVSVPVGAGELGLPVGLQLAARPGQEQRLVDAGITLERALVGSSHP